MKNLNRSKIVGVAAVSLAAVSLIGVGFASWVVGGITNADAQTVTATVGTVTDNRVKVTAGVNDGTVKIDSKSGGTVLVGSGDEENLDFSFKYTVTTTNFFDTSNLKVKLTLTGTLIDLLSGEGSTYLTLSKDETTGNTFTETSTYVFEKTLNNSVTDEIVAFKFAWGGFFGYDNPSMLTDAKKVQSYIDALNAMRDKTIIGTFTAESVKKA
ncbi:MAG: hypothetical protein PUG97_06590 [bacterium]|nr:hypothetical protein [bacterium]MDD7329402.1 hypothetical protein [bacterium]MDY2895785.1 hypothetical protein [Candidatus Enterosoma sp.]MDY5257372.1 hypothetical protein [Candidatus Enterosoma sp.]